MPTYYIDVYDNDEMTGDDDGIELDSLYEARQQAIAILPDLARDKLPDGDRHTFKVVVKCREGRVRYVASLTLNGGWVEPPAYAEGEFPPEARRSEPQRTLP